MLNSLRNEVRQKYLNTVIYNVVQPLFGGSLVQPALPAQGVNNGQREGDSIHVDKIQVRMSLLGTGANDGIRLVCLQARASTVLTLNYSTAPTTGIFDLGSSGQVDVTSFPNFNAINETYHVLYDESYCVTEASNSACIIRQIELIPKIKEINFTPTTTTSLMGGIYWVAFSYNAQATIALEQRLVYHDM